MPALDQLVDKCADSLARATEWLATSVITDRYTLACRASDNSFCPINRKGRSFAAFFLSEALAPAFPGAVRRLLVERLESEERAGAWGYEPHSPVDADDTALALRALCRLGRPGSLDGLLRFHHPTAGLFSTFPRPTPPCLVFEPACSNNAHAHPDVLASVAMALIEYGRPDLVNAAWIEDTQAQSGCWRSYFYPSPYYATHMFLEVARQTGIGSERQRRGLAFLLNNRNSDGSWGCPPNAYETALAIASLAARGVGGSPQAVSPLLEMQRASGEWMIEMPVWRYRFRPAIDWQAYDDYGVVCTSLCVSALRAWGRTVS